MAKKQCNSCRGIYDDVSADGVPYAHVCAPITFVAIERDGAAQAVPLTELQPTDVIVVKRGDRAIELPAADVAPDDVRLGDEARERPNKRDENPAPVSRLDAPNTKRAIRAEGDGAKTIG